MKKHQLTALGELTGDAREEKLRAYVAQQNEATEALKVLRPSHSTETKTEKTTVVPTKPASSGIDVDNSRLIRAIGALVLGGGLIALIIWQFGGAELIQLLLYVALPLLLLFAAFRLMGYGTLQLVWNGSIEERVNAYMGSLKTQKVVAKTA